MTILPGAMNTFRPHHLVLHHRVGPQDGQAEGLGRFVRPDGQTHARPKVGGANYLIATFLLGSMFIVLKLVEWSHLVAEGFTIGVQNEPTSPVRRRPSFYISTGAHGVHVFVGLLVMLYLIFKADTVGYDEKKCTGHRILWPVLALC